MVPSSITMKCAITQFASIGMWTFLRNTLETYNGANSTAVAMMKNKNPVHWVWLNVLDPHCIGSSEPMTRKRLPDFGRRRCSVVSWCKLLSKHNCLKERSKNKRDHYNPWRYHHFHSEVTGTGVLRDSPSAISSVGRLGCKFKILFQSDPLSTLSTSFMSTVVKIVRKKSICHLFSTWRFCGTSNGTLTPLKYQTVNRSEKACRIVYKRSWTSTNNAL